MSNIRVIQVIVILLVLFVKPFVSFGYFSDITKSFNFKYYYDNVGSTIALTNDAEQVIERIEYAPFGKQTHRSRTEGHAGTFHDTPFLWTGFFGNQTDSNDLIYLRARYYNTLIRRFVNSDPARDGWNWHAYAGGNPMSFVDPTGLGLNAALDAVQTSLSFLGLIPAVGNIFDVANAGISIGRGNFGSAAVDFAAAIPGFGQAVTGAKFAGVGIGVVATTGRISRTTSTKTFRHYGFAEDATKFEGGLKPGSFATHGRGRPMHGTTAQQKLSLPHASPPNSYYKVKVDNNVSIIGPNPVQPTQVPPRPGRGIEYEFPKGTPPGSVEGPFPIP